MARPRPGARDYETLRARMVDRQLRRRGIDDDRVLSAMGAVPRERFVPRGQRRLAYRDSALPLGCGQTVSQPWIVAAICQGLELTGAERVLEVGTGSGYSTAVLSCLAREVISIERHEALATAAMGLLAELGIVNAEVRIGDGSAGLPDRSPFEAIAVHATAPGAPRSLLNQLTDGGRLVAPVDGADGETLMAYRRAGGGTRTEPIASCRFVPLIGREGYEEP